MHAFHENPNCIHTEFTFINLKGAYHEKLYVLSTAEIFEASYTNSVDTDQTAPVGLIWVHTVCLYAYVK